MWFLLYSAFAGLAVGQLNSTTSVTSLLSSASVMSSTPVLSAASSVATSAITVALDGSGQYTAINAAVNAAQNSAIPTVTVLPGNLKILP